MAVPERLSIVPYEIIVPLGSTNTALPDAFSPYCSYFIVWYATVPVKFSHWNTGEFPGNTAAYVPGVFIASTKLVTHP